MSDLKVGRKVWTPKGYGEIVGLIKTHASIRLNTGEKLTMTLELISLLPDEKTS